jgi:hypothetical protein
MSKMSIGKIITSALSNQTILDAILEDGNTTIDSLIIDAVAEGSIEIAFTLYTRYQDRVKDMLTLRALVMNAPTYGVGLKIIAHAYSLVSERPEIKDVKMGDTLPRGGIVDLLGFYTIKTDSGDESS